jgi:hypothetical protein
MGSKAVFFVSPDPDILGPDDALERLRELHAEGGPRDFEEAINLFMAIDSYLVQGGSLPPEWKQVRDVAELTERCEQLVAHVNQEDEEADRMREALEFYADPENYHAIAFLPNRPCGEFAEDFDENHGHPDYDRPMPGKRAREALKEMNDGRED